MKPDGRDPPPWFRLAILAIIAAAAGAMLLLAGIQSQEQDKGRSGFRIVGDAEREG